MSYWGSFSEDQPKDPTGGQNPMHKLMGELFAKGALVLHGEQEFEYHRTPVVGDVLDGVGRITDVYEKETSSANMTFVVIETSWNDASTGAPVVTERFNLIARLKK
jgi:hydroxyacyl-ACP dehydratase HTD2-like protein with hotdog domain